MHEYDSEKECGRVGRQQRAFGIHLRRFTIRECESEKGRGGLADRRGVWDSFEIDYEARL